jgi:hypothetical protein
MPNPKKIGFLRSVCVVQAGFQLLGLLHPSALASPVAGTTGIQSPGPALNEIIFKVAEQQK